MTAAAQASTRYTCDRCGHDLPPGTAIVLASGRTVNAKGQLQNRPSANPDRHYCEPCWRRPEDIARILDDR